MAAKISLSDLDPVTRARVREKLGLPDESLGAEAPRKPSRAKELAPAHPPVAARKPTVPIHRMPRRAALAPQLPRWYRQAVIWAWVAVGLAAFAKLTIRPTVVPVPHYPHFHHRGK